MKISLTWGKKLTLIWGTQRVPNKINSNGCTPRHTVIKMTKIKDKRESLKQKEKNSTSYILYGIYHMGNTRMTFLEKFCRTEEGDTTYVKWWKEKICNQIIQHSKAVIEIWRRGSFTDKQKLWEFSTTKLALQEMLNRLL